MIPSKFRCKLLFLSHFTWMLFRPLLLAVLFFILFGGFIVLFTDSTVIDMLRGIGILGSSLFLKISIIPPFGMPPFDIPVFVIVILLSIAISLTYEVIFRDLKGWKPSFDPHKWGDWEYEEGSCTKVMKCLICGVKNAIEVRVHDWVWKYEREGSCHTIEHCSKCAEEQRGVRHDWGERKYTSVCEFTQQCLRCGEIKNDDEHEWGDGIGSWEGDTWRTSSCGKCGTIINYTYDPSYNDLIK